MQENLTFYMHHTYTNGIQKNKCTNVFQNAHIVPYNKQYVERYKMEESLLDKESKIATGLKC